MSFHCNATAVGLHFNKTSLTPWERTETQAWVGVTVVICIFGTLGNALVLLITLPKSGTKSSLNLLIFHFVLGNLFMCLINVPVKCVMVLLWQAGHVGTVEPCLYVHSMFLVVRQVVFWSDACLAINRCIALYFPFRYASWTNKWVTFGWLAFTWAISLVHAVKIGVGFGGAVTQVPLLGICSFRPSRTPTGQFLNLLGYVPVAIAGIGAVLILFKVHHMASSLSATTVAPLSQARDAASRVARRRIRMVRMLLLSFALTAVCNIPPGIFAFNFSTVFLENPVASLWPQFGEAFQYGFTPFVLVLSNADYRAQIWKIATRGELYSHSGPEPT